MTELITAPAVAPAIMAGQGRCQSSVNPKMPASPGRGTISPVSSAWTYVCGRHRRSLRNRVSEVPVLRQAMFGLYGEK
jgi:hypothetical protein